MQADSYLEAFYAIFCVFAICWRFHGNFKPSPVFSADFSEAKSALVLNIYAT